MASEEDLEDIRRRKMLELHQQLDNEQRKVKQEETLEVQKQALLRQVLTTEARERLNRIKLVKPEFAAQIELQLIQIAQSGKVRLPITDDQLKLILTRLQPSKREIKFRRV
ncbi:MAG: programmed cell death protein 5 [Thermoproteota archaeon]|nr:programmed cell death protein 5 [Thermoproteota archaeon]